MSTKKTKQDLVKEVKALKRRIEKLEEDGLDEASRLDSRFMSMMPYIIILASKEGKIININRVLSGYNKEDVIGKDVKDFVDKKYIKRHKDKIKEAHNTGKTQSLSIVADGSDGKKAWYKTSFIPVNKKKGWVYMVSDDITQEKLAEQELLGTKLSLEIIFGQMPVNVWTIDKNKEITSLLGPGIKEVSNNYIGKPISKVLSSDDKDRTVINAALSKVLKGHKVSFERHAYNKVFQQNVEPLKENGKIIGAIGISHDITSSKEKELLLKESEERFKVLSEAAFEGIAISEKGIIIDANDQFARIHGYRSAKELIGKRLIEDFVVKEMQQAAKRYRKGNSKEVFEITTLKKDGTKVFLESKGKNVHIDGKTVRITVAYDITQRKEREIEQERTQALYRNLVEMSPDGIFIHDKKGNILFANKSALAIMGVSKLQQLKSRSVFHWVLPEYHEQIKKGKSQLEPKRGRKFKEAKLKRPDGHIIPVEYMPIPFNYENKDAVLVVYHDLSIREQLEKERLRAQIAEETNKELKKEILIREMAEKEVKRSLKEKEVLLNEVHHRVKNNLQVISSILNLQSSYIDNKHIQSILKESQNRIKSMSFIHESLYQSQDFSGIKFSDYIINLSNNLFHTYVNGERNIGLQLNIEDVLLNMDHAIPCGLILNELITNSLKYAFSDNSDNKKVLKIDLHQVKDKVEIKIRDNGKGLPKDIDFRNTQTLGLQLVMTLVEQLNATIELSNTNGAAFKISFKQIN